MNKNIVVIILGVVGVLFLVVAFIYFTKPAEMLPSFFPGHQAGLTKIHYKHGIGALILSVGSFILAWFQSGKKSVK